MQVALLKFLRYCQHCQRVLRSLRLLDERCSFTPIASLAELCKLRSPEWNLGPPCNRHGTIEGVAKLFISERFSGAYKDLSPRTMLTSRSKVPQTLTRDVFAL